MTSGGIITQFVPPATTNDTVAISYVPAAASTLKSAQPPTWGSASVSPEVRCVGWATENHNANAVEAFRVTEAPGGGRRVMRPRRNGGRVPLCRHFLRGNCLRGEACPFAHETQAMLIGSGGHDSTARVEGRDRHAPTATVARDCNLVRSPRAYTYGQPATTVYRGRGGRARRSSKRGGILAIAAAPVTTPTALDERRASVASVAETAASHKDLSPRRSLEVTRGGKGKENEATGYKAVDFGEQSAMGNASTFSKCAAFEWPFWSSPIAFGDLPPVALVRVDLSEPTGAFALARDVPCAAACVGARES